MAENFTEESSEVVRQMVGTRRPLPPKYTLERVLPTIAENKFESDVSSSSEYKSKVV